MSDIPESADDLIAFHRAQIARSGQPAEHGRNAAITGLISRYQANAAAGEDEIVAALHQQLRDEVAAW